MEVKLYSKSNCNELWWCNVHNRIATYMLRNTRHCCDPSLSGIMIPCNCVELTNILEIEES